MNNELILAVASIFTTFIVGLLSQRVMRQNAKFPIIQDVFKQQLEHIYTPMDKLLSFWHGVQPQELLNLLCQIVEKHYSLVPPEILKEIESLSSRTAVDVASFDRLRLMVSSFYNWTRKKLEYPYDPEKLNRRYEPSSGKKAEQNIHLAKTILIVMLLLAIGFILALIYSAKQNGWLLYTLFGCINICALFLCTILDRNS